MPERWDEVDRVWHALLERPEPERAAAIDELCGQDLTLRRDIKSLLAHLARASAAGFGVAAVGVAGARESLIGRQLGPYAVHTLLGAGGMGEVFQATDSTLDREIAFKILPDMWLADPDRQARFDREARLLASLNHPNIGSIYGVHVSGSVRALVLELVEGQTLAERLASRAGTSRVSRGLPIADVVIIAAQIIDALEAAHARGIVHRDLKPANIKITPEMRVKVLDFGLALAMSGANGDSSASSSSAISGNVTHAGALLGTPAYMSPEQARARSVDTRTDIWAFGCVLYEMLTGAQAFGGDSVGKVLANVIRGEPDWTALPADTPRTLRVCLRRCLQKDPGKRFHHVADVRLALEGAFELPPSDGDLNPRFRSLVAQAASSGWAVAALVAVVAIIAIVIAARRTPTTSPEPRVAVATPPVLVSQRTGGGGTATATTIQEAIDIAARGATVSVLPGTYAEALRITKGLTLEATGERSGLVVIAPRGRPDSTIEVATTDPVTIRGLTIQVPGTHGIRGTGSVDLTVERSTVVAVDPPSGRSALIAVSNDASVTGGRARTAVRRSMIDGTITKLPPGVPRPQSHAVQLVGDLDAVLEGNMVRRTGAICIVVGTREDFGGYTSVEILNNDIDECHPIARVSAIKVGIPSVLTLSPEQPITATGIVDIIGNTIRNTSEDCLASAIAFDVFSGRIERNRIVNFVQPCAMPTSRNLPGAIWLGLRGDARIPKVAPTVRFNDIVGNTHAGLRLAPNYPVPVDASCNFWGSEMGPSGVGPGRGDILLVGRGAAAPVFLPFATVPIARATHGGC